MRIRLWIQAALVAFAVPASLLGQFQQPTPEELKMTADPKAPGADAVYLYREEKGDDTLHYHSLYVRIKVLTEKGKELASVSRPYPKGEFTVNAIQGRTIHADGTVIPLNVKPTDLVEIKDKGLQINKMVFTLPSVEVGSILEYRLQLRYDDQWVDSPWWDVQQPYFVHKAHYMFIPHPMMAERLLYSVSLPNGVKVQKDVQGRYTLDVTDVPAAPDEEYMPPIGSLLGQVKFYYTEFSNKEDFWKHEGERWSKQDDHFAAQTKTLKEYLTGIVLPADSQEVKATKIYDAVMALDNTDYTRRKSASELKELHQKRAKDAEDVWRQKSGSSEEIALLYLALVRAAGLKAYALIVCNRDRELFSQYFLSFDQFDDTLVIVNIDGKEKVVDPGAKFAYFGQLDWRHCQVSGLRQTDKGTEFVGTPANSFKEASTVRLADLTVAPDGSVTGSARITMNGLAALRWRQLVLENDEEEVKKQFNEEMREMVPDGIDPEFDHFLGLDDYHSVLMGIVKISGNMGTATGKRMFLPGLFFASHARHPFVAVQSRQTSVDMHYADVVRDEVTYHLPAAVAVESAPADTTIPWAGHAAFGLKAVSRADEITVARSLIRGFALLPPSEYPALRDFYQKVATADQQPLVLTAAATVKGGAE